MVSLLLLGLLLQQSCLQNQLKVPEFKSYDTMLEQHNRLPKPLNFGLKLATSKDMQHWDFCGGPVAKTLLPMQGVQVCSLVRELDPMYHN